MAYIPGYSSGGIGWNDKAAYDRYTSKQGQFKLAKGINPNVPGWGDYMDPDWQLVGFGGDVGGRTESKYGTRIRPDTSFAVLERRAPQQQAAPAAAAAPAETTTPTVEPPRTTPADPGPPESKSIADSFAAQIATMQSGFKESLSQQASLFADMQRAQEERMTALQQQMQQSQALAAAQAASAAAANRPTTAGVKTATGAAGSLMQIARSGVRGAFNRAGMRISGLNV